MAAAAESDHLVIGHAHIKQRRLHTLVPVAPFGVVADYVPFYFAPRSPMLFAIHRNQVAGHRGGQEPIVYLVVSLEELLPVASVVFTDRNASLAIAQFSSDSRAATSLVDWDLMNLTWLKLVRSVGPVDALDGVG
ncbi:MAG: DUF4433 domain-containing protein [Candidatus Nanopelagicales bacterium]|nr:DUF4433 domain-containing protein [Candidatus Nanopelagicales bacterium]MDZ4250718.1 DUF4433 domain-containing protein [Candidatus Nanopelagicales bacterium]